MNWLAQLKEKEKGSVTSPTKPTKGVFEGFVGNYLSSCSDTGGATKSGAGNDLGAAPDPERSDAPKIFNAWQTLFMNRGLSTSEAEATVVMLERRNAGHDERRLCLECSHMYGSVAARRCSQWRQLGNFGPAMPADLVSILQRCRCFHAELEASL